MVIQIPEAPAPPTLGCKFWSCTPDQWQAYFTKVGQYVNRLFEQGTMMFQSAKPLIGDISSIIQKIPRRKK